MNCRFCRKTLTHEFIDLVNAPPSNAFLTKEQLNEPEVFYPLKLFVCDSCFLVQIGEYKKSSDIFDSEYVYFSSFSKTWLAHAKKYADMMIGRYGYNQNSQIIEIASNDGYLLQYFQEKGIPSLGIEPAEGTAVAARKKGIETIVDFFGKRLAHKLVNEGKKGDLVIGNNVLAHVPNINDFVQGLKILLKDKGLITMEFPHLMQLVENNQFDTIYHEHFSYFSLYTVQTIFKHHGLDIFDVEELGTHGGSLRVYIKHMEDDSKENSEKVLNLLDREDGKGMLDISYYLGFQEKADKVKYDLLDFLIDKKRQSKTIVGYGAAAKGNTLMNYCGIKRDMIDFVVDLSPYKQGKYLPGSHIPVVSEEQIKKLKPDYVLILPWNIKQEIMEQLSYIRMWNGHFFVAVPDLRVGM
jgi:C-methyltransferase C-terminal domain/Putative zinc binding domain/Methyltransferase domain